MGARFALAVLATATLGSIAQTQSNLAALAALGQPVGFGLRLQVSGLDLLRFAPLFAGIVACGFLIALPLASRWRQRWQVPWLHPLAGAAAVLTALWLMRALFGLTAIAAAREPAGFLALMLCGACGGWVYAATGR